MKTFNEIIRSGKPKGGEQHTPDSLKSFGRRLDREKKIRDGIFNDPKSGFNRHADAIINNQPKWTKIDGVNVYHVPGSKIAAFPANDKKSSPKWVVFDIEARKELTQISKKELMQYLSRYAVDTEGLK